MLATTLLLKEGRYNIEQEFTAPDNCARFQAFDTVGEKAVTIVEVPVRLPKVATAAQRDAINSSFEKQASALENFSHRSVSAIHDHFSEGGRHYVVTDLVDGIDLEASIEGQKRPYPYSDVMEWADAILEALNLLHVSRPPTFFKAIQPANLVLKSDKTISLLLPSAIICGEAASLSSSNDAVCYSPLEQLWNGLDAASQKVIINKYDEASERILKQDLDARSDVYSLGATLYFLVTARRPVDVLERSIEIIEGNADPLKSPHKIDPAIPTEISDVIMKAMEIKREYRFDSAAIMRQVLKTALVRVKEREAEEALEQEEAAADIQRAVMERQSPNGNGNIAAEQVEEAEEAEVALEKLSDNVTADRAAEQAESLLAKQLREAEEKRLEAERRAAEAEKKLRETEARVTESFNLAELDDDLLGLLAPHTSEAPESAAQKLHTSTQPNVIEAPVTVPEVPVEVAAEAIEPVTETQEEVRQVFAAPVVIDEPVEEFEVEVLDDSTPEIVDGPFEEIEVVEVEAVAETEEPVVEDAVTEIADTENVADDVIEVAGADVRETPVEDEPTPTATAVAFTPEPRMDPVQTHAGTYDDVTPPRSGLPIPALAAVGGVLLVVVIGGWALLGSSSTSSSSATPEQKVETQTVAPAAETKPEEPARTSYQSETQPQPEAAPAAQTVEPVSSGPDTQQSQKTAAAQNQKKDKKPTAAPAKSPTQKKAVTVDDLINDN